MYEFEFVGVIKYSDDRGCYLIEFNQGKYDNITFVANPDIPIREHICIVVIALKDLRFDQMLNIKIMP